MELTPRRLGPDDPALAEVLSLIRTAFAFMEGRIDPPSSMHRLSPESVAEQAGTGEVWTIGSPVQACMFLSPKSDALYLGKLAVALDARGRGLARMLIRTAEIRARTLGLSCIELQTRIELTDNHATFAAMGFHETGRTAHPGYDRPTSITFRKSVGG